MNAIDPGTSQIGRLMRRADRIPYMYRHAVLLIIKLLLLRHFFLQDIGWSHFTADAAAVIALLCVLELISPTRWKGPVYWAFNALISLILFASTLYYAHFTSVPTYTALLELHQVLQIKSSVQSTLQWSYYLYFADIVILAIVGLIVRLRRGRRSSTRPLRRTLVALACVLCLGVSARYIEKGMTIDNELVAAEDEGFLNYQVGAAIKAKQESNAVSDGNLEDVIAQVQALQATYTYQDTPPASGKPASFGAAAGKNLILLQLEAFQNFPLHLSIDGKEITPVLNKLADESLYFPHVYQQIGQGNTSDAEFMANTSIYPTGKIPMSTGYGNRAMPSLPRLVQDIGYKAFTFHVNNVQFWDRNQLYPALHFDQYFDKPYYQNDHFNDFGASDEELYRVGIEKLTAQAKAGQPFYAQFVTASSHFPFKVPADRQQITLPANLQGTQMGDYLTAVNYTDYAIGKLIDGLKANGLWDNTVLALYGDHFGLQTEQNDPKKIKETLGITYDPLVSRFNIPFIVHVPGTEKGKRVEQVGGQLDIMPTLANLLGISLEGKSFTAFGHDLLNINHNVLGSRYYLPTGSFFNDDVLFVPGKGFDDGTAVSLKTLQPVTDLAPYRRDYDYMMKLMSLSDHYVRLLPKRTR